MSIKQYEKYFKVSRSTVSRGLKRLLDTGLISKAKTKGRGEIFYIVS